MCRQLHNSCELLVSHSDAQLCSMLDDFDCYPYNSHPSVKIIDKCQHIVWVVALGCLRGYRGAWGDPLAMKLGLSCRYLNYLSIDVRVDYIERARTRARICCQNHNPVVVPTTYESSRLLAKLLLFLPHRDRGLLLLLAHP